MNTKISREGKSANGKNLLSKSNATHLAETKSSEKRNKNADEDFVLLCPHDEVETPFLFVGFSAGDFLITELEAQIDPSDAIIKNADGIYFVRKTADLYPENNVPEINVDFQKLVDSVIHAK